MNTSYIDLSVALNQETPVYPGDPATRIEQAHIIGRDGCNDHYVSFGTHIGTHIDAPRHMIAGGKTLGRAPIKQFIGRGRIVIVDEEFKMQRLQRAGVREGDIVLFCTNMSSYYYEPKYFENYPVMPEEMAHYLVKCKVKMVGIDAASVDKENDFPIHKILLAGNVFIIENLTHLNQLTGREFTVYALPVKLDLDGAPARVIAGVQG